MGLDFRPDRRTHGAHPDPVAVHPAVHLPRLHRPAVPGLLMALVLMYVGTSVFHADVGGLFSSEYADAPWSWGRVGDLASYLSIPVIILGTSGVASLLRIMPAN